MKKLIFTAAALSASLALAACDVDQTEEGEMPEVNVEGGNMPEYDVTTPEVEVGTEETTVEVPTVDITPAEDAAGEPATGDEE
ncbi:hypothetical protein [Qipengyuania spongiae]|uniref:Secreted protein n=1 Tax=Qipengyuania spongiae TaxID=2909673 RepID=A0ABY5SZC3_9SPHN|nr:hypothetical protein [Qipengyuania spongiae]UVI39887.1 hypothetical protein L1F33_02695 [Qipengyuania spongiae]